MNLEIQPYREPNFAPYQKECFLLSQQGLHPPFNTHPDALEAQAKEALSKGGWLYAACNAGVGWTHRANREGKLTVSRFRDFVSQLTISAFYRYTINFDLWMPDPELTAR